VGEEFFASMLPRIQKAKTLVVQLFGLSNPK
jgi:hypothetical protein